MNVVEERLRDALSARAATVTQDPKAYDTIVRRRTRYRVTRIVRPVVGALAAAAMVAVILTVFSGPAKQDAVPAVGGPRLVLVIRAVPAKDTTGNTFHRNETVLLDARTMTGPPALHIAYDTYPIEHVTAAGDDLTFYGVAQRDRCNFPLLRISPESGTAPIGEITGWQPTLAVSRDGRQLAYTYTPVDNNDTCNSEDGFVLTVRDLVTGKERTWRATPTGPDYKPTRLAWSPDGHTIAFQHGLTVGTFDTNRPGTTIELPDRSGLLRGPQGSSCTAEAPAYLPDGELVVAWRCLKSSIEASAVSVFDVERQTAIRTLFRLPDGADPVWLTLDRTGEHALVGLEGPRTSRSRPPTVVVRWDGKGKAKQIDTGDDRMVEAAW